MGTNYYSVKRDIEHLVMMDFYDLHERCYDLDGNDVLHIGKSSSGWCFSLHVIPEQGINSLQDWVKLFIDPERMILISGARKKWIETVRSQDQTTW